MKFKCLGLRVWESGSLGVQEFRSLGVWVFGQENVCGSS